MIKTYWKVYRTDWRVQHVFSTAHVTGSAENPTNDYRVARATLRARFRRRDGYKLVRVTLRPKSAQDDSRALANGLRLLYAEPVTPSVCRQTTCRLCGLEIENLYPFTPGEWRDRGNNTHCPEDDTHVGILHDPVPDNPTGWQEG